MKYSKVTYDPLTNLYSVPETKHGYRTKGPLNVGFQITRRCNLKCIYCSESPYLEDISLDKLEKAFSNLKRAGVLKINLTGGEALLRKDLKDIVILAKSLDFHVAIDSNAILMTEEMADFLSGKLAYFESTIDGSPQAHNKVRGRYIDVISGIRKVTKTNTPVYIAMLLLGDCLDDAKHTLQTSSELGAKCVKFLTPIPKARGKSLPNNFLNNLFLQEIWEKLSNFREREHLSPEITLADWSKIGKGSVILVYPDGQMVGSPSIGEPGCITPMGNLLETEVVELWADYPHKKNHINKYIGKTMIVQG